MIIKQNIATELGVCTPYAEAVPVDARLARRRERSDNKKRMAPGANEEKRNPSGPAALLTRFRGDEEEHDDSPEGSDLDMPGPTPPDALTAAVVNSLEELWQGEVDATGSPTKKTKFTLPSPPHTHEGLGRRVQGLSVSPNFRSGHSPPKVHPHPKDKNTAGLLRLGDHLAVPDTSKRNTYDCGNCGRSVEGLAPCPNCNKAGSSQTAPPTTTPYSIASFFKPPPGTARTTGGNAGRSSLL
jgi:hypothetical protein